MLRQSLSGVPILCLRSKLPFLSLKFYDASCLSLYISSVGAMLVPIRCVLCSDFTRIMPLFVSDAVPGSLSRRTLTILKALNNRLLEKSTINRTMTLAIKHNDLVRRSHAFVYTKILLGFYILGLRRASFLLHNPPVPYSPHIFEGKIIQTSRSSHNIILESRTTCHSSQLFHPSQLRHSNPQCQAKS